MFVWANNSIVAHVLNCSLQNIPGIDYSFVILYIFNILTFFFWLGSKFAFIIFNYLAFSFYPGTKLLISIGMHLIHGLLLVSLMTVRRQVEGAHCRYHLLSLCEFFLSLFFACLGIKLKGIRLSCNRTYE